MSETYQDESDVPTEVICQRLEEIAAASLQNKEALFKQMQIHIPFRVEHDADCILREAAKRLKAWEPQKTQETQNGG